MRLGGKEGEKEIARTNDMEFLKLKLLDLLSYSVPLNEFENCASYQEKLEVLLYK